MKCNRPFEMTSFDGGLMQRRYAVLVILVLILGTSGFASVTNPSITITGGEQSSGGIWDHGTITVTVNGSYETVSYGQFSTPSSIASAIAAAFSKDCMAPVNAKATGAIITFEMRGSGSFGSVSFSSVTGDPAHFSQGSFTADTTSLWSISSPYILSLSPNTGAAGTVITISGMNFGEAQGSSTVTINGTTVSPMNWDSGNVIVALPSGVGSGNVVVTVGGVASNGVAFTVGGSCQL